MSHLENIKKQLSGISLAAEYWDLRVEDSIETNIFVLNGEIVTCGVNPALGAFLRVRKNGFWFYESTTDLSNLRGALEALDKKPSPGKGAGNYSAQKHEPYLNIAYGDKNFGLVLLEDKKKLARGYANFASKFPKIASMRLRYTDSYKTKSFLNNAGTFFEFDSNQGGFLISYSLKDGAALFDDREVFFADSFPALKGKESRIEQVIAESTKFLSAPAVSPGTYRVLMDSEVSGVFTHESFGHKSESDFMLGNEDALKEWKLGTKIGSDCLSIVDYGSHAGTSGFCPIDDEGVPAQKNYLIKNGVLAGRLHSRETATSLGEIPSGNARALSFEFEPIVRMTSTYIEQGAESMQSILARAEGGILIQGLKHGSGMSTFTIAPSRGYKILAGGKLDPVRVTVISGSVFETLSKVEAVSAEFQLHSSTIGGCGKMDQWPLPVAFGGPYVLVSEMQVT